MWFFCVLEFQSNTSHFWQIILHEICEAYLQNHSVCMCGCCLVVFMLVTNAPLSSFSILLPTFALEDPCTMLILNHLSVSAHDAIFDVWIHYCLYFMDIGLCFLQLLSSVMMNENAVGMGIHSSPGSIQLRGHIPDEWCPQPIPARICPSLVCFLILCVGQGAVGRTHLANFELWPCLPHESLCYSNFFIAEVTHINPYVGPLGFQKHSLTSSTGSDWFA